VRCLIPFGTAWAFVHTSKKALGNSKSRWVAALVGGALILVLAGGYERMGDALIDEAAAPFKRSESQAAREAAIRRLARWRFLLPDGAIGRRAVRFNDIDTEAFASHYREVTGVDLRLWGRIGGD